MVESAEETPLGVNQSVSLEPLTPGSDAPAPQVLLIEIDDVHECGWLVPRPPANTLVNVINLYEQDLGGR